MDLEIQEIYEDGKIPIKCFHSSVYPPILFEPQFYGNQSHITHPNHIQNINPPPPPL